VLEQLVGIGIAVMAEPDLAVVLERIVAETRRFTGAEAATLFVRDGQDLTVAVSQNERVTSRRAELALRGSVVNLESTSLPAFVARTAEILDVPDAYRIPGHAPYTFDDAWDQQHDYRTRSVLLVPLVDRVGYTLGVLQLTNARGERDEVTPFDVDADARQIVRALAAHASVAIQNARLAELSFIDTLTGAYNRRFFMVRLEQELNRHTRYRQPLAVVLFDVDDFKPINDRFGHAAGDAALTTLSRLLSAQSRGFTVIARLGGDEFGAVLPQTSKEGALQYAERIRRLIEAYPFRHGRVTLSIGVASLPEDVPASSGPVADALMHAADRALYEAKRQGRNRVASTPA
jgi:diguanylate cyclase (GGDEF)-like protein